MQDLPGRIGRQSTGQAALGTNPDQFDPLAVADRFPIRTSVESFLILIDR